MSDTACPLCFPVDETLLWRDAFCRAIWVDDANYPGFCRVILNAHVKEMTDLPPEQRQRLMAVVFAVETALREIAKPDKINLASLGNVVPHMHWHVIPRWENDVNFPDAIWAASRRANPTRALPADFRQRIQTRIQALMQSRE
ncbi:MAG: HIT family protein [Hydrogenophilales bacterium 28-61-23]|nr:MAG: HIT family protein [Hydrogenophilales bacterium 28-61-23]